MRTPAGPRVTTHVPTRESTSSALQPVFWVMRLASYSLENRISAPSISGRIRSPSPKASCCEGSARNAVAALAALLGVAQHALRVVGADDDVVGLADAVDDRLELDLARLAHRAGVEAGDLRVRAVVGAHEARGVPGLGDVHGVAVDVVALEPGAVVGEVLADRADQHRAQAEVAEPEADVGRAATPAHLQVLDEEGHRQLVELVDDQAVGEPAREGHQVVGRDGSGNEEGHDAKHYLPVQLGIPRSSQ